MLSISFFLKKKKKHIRFKFTDKICMKLQFLPVLLRYNWHTALYRFKVYSIMNDKTYTPRNDHPNKFTEHSSSLVGTNYKKKTFFPCVENS